MKIYDISQEVFSCNVYPGDDAPQMQPVCRMDRGDTYNLTNMSMCVHNGTHIDAPFHFFNDGTTVENIPLSKMVGYCFVTDFNGILTAKDVQNIVNQAKNYAIPTRKDVSTTSNATQNPPLDDCWQRILFKGDVTVTPQSAQELVTLGVQLVGTTEQTFGTKNTLADVHKTLLSAQVVMLEGVRLQHVPQGQYLLCAQPLCLAGCDGSPTRAILIEM